MVKEKREDIRKLYDYLNSRSFTYFPPLIDDTREDINVFSYVKESYAPKEQKALDLIKMIALLHQKTTYYKDVTSDEYKKIYDELKEQICLEFNNKSIIENTIDKNLPKSSVRSKVNLKEKEEMHFVAAFIKENMYLESMEGYIDHLNYIYYKKLLEVLNNVPS